MATAATLVSSTGSWAVVRRSTSGSAWRTSKRPQSSEDDEPADDRAERAGIAPAPGGPLGDPDQEGDQPDRQPGDADEVEPAGVGVADVGDEHERSSSRTTPASTAESQNRACQSWSSAIHADSGRPIAPPTPRVALIAAIAVPVSRGGVISRISEMPTGMKPIARPCRARPASIGTSESDSAHTTEPDEQDRRR